jgi:hypothetical protein
MIGKSDLEYFATGARRGILNASEQIALVREVSGAQMEIERLRQALGDYGEHDAGCPKRYVQVQFCARMKTEGKCECGLDEELGIAAAEHPAAPGRETGNE